MQIENDEVANIVVQRLFQMGDVNVRASQVNSKAGIKEYSGQKLNSARTNGAHVGRVAWQTRNSKSTRAVWRRSKHAR